MRLFAYELNCFCILLRRVYIIDMNWWIFYFEITNAYVREVSGGFESLLNLFVALPVPGVNTCVPGRTRWARSNGVVGFLSTITNNEIPTKLSQFSMGNKMLKQYFPNLCVATRVPQLTPSPFDTARRVLPGNIQDASINIIQKIFNLEILSKIAFLTVICEYISTWACAIDKNCAIWFNSMRSIDWIVYR